jgi:hypothetical protein
VRRPPLRRVGLAALAGVLLMALVLGVSALVAEDRPEVDLGTGAEKGALEEAVQLLAPTLAGDPCPDVRRAPGAEQRDAVALVQETVRENREDMVADPRDPAAEIPLTALPPLVAGEIEGCVRRARGASPAWSRLAADLR